MRRSPPDPLDGKDRWKEGGVDMGSKEALDFGASPLAFAEGFGMVGSDRLFCREGSDRDGAPTS